MCLWLSFEAATAFAVILERVDRGFSLSDGFEDRSWGQPSALK
jgi:hypothetical protein